MMNAETVTTLLIIWGVFAPPIASVLTAIYYRMHYADAYVIHRHLRRGLRAGMENRK